MDEDASNNALRAAQYFAAVCAGVIPSRSGRTAAGVYAQRMGKAKARTVIPGPFRHTELGHKTKSGKYIPPYAITRRAFLRASKRLTDILSGKA